MLPIIPIVAAVTSAAVLIHRKFKQINKNRLFQNLAEFVRIQGIPIDSEYHFDPNALTPSGVPLLFEVMTNPDLLISLLNYGANPNICDPYGTPAIIYALSLTELVDCEDVVSILLRYGADPNRMNSEGKTAIFYAKSSKILEILNAAGADVNAIDEKGKTALFYTLSDNETLTVLIKMGADINAADETGKTALFYTLSDIDTFKALIDLGADVNVKDCEGKTILSYVSGRDDFPVVDFLEKRNIINLKEYDKNDFMFLYEYHQLKNMQRVPDQSFNSAVNNNDIDEVRRILTKGVNLDTRHEVMPNWNMIHLAVCNNNPDMIEVLVKGGVNIEGTGPETSSPLRKAVYEKKTECFKKLLELGADPKSAENEVRNQGTDEIKQIYKNYIEMDQ